METGLKVLGAILMAVIAVLQFFLDLVQRPGTRWIVAAIAFVAVLCFAIAEFIGDRSRKRERKRWEEGQVERDQQMIGLIVSRIKSPEVMGGAPVTQPIVPLPVDVMPNDPRVYPVSIKEIKDAIFPSTAFVFTNRGGDVAHRVKVDMLFKLKGHNVDFPGVEVIAVDETCEVVPTVGGESLSNKRNIFHWLLEDWNANAGSLVEDWPKEMNVRWQNYKGDRFVCALTLVFHPIDYMLRRNDNWPKHDFVVVEFKNIRFHRE
ncbi:MAG: hypothetical protein HY010_09615 [Acidobacteria bacterium]|nr:hypothetical protein [Acidobacteriota bacterium]